MVQKSIPIVADADEQGYERRGHAAVYGALHRDRRRTVPRRAGGLGGVPDTRGMGTFASRLSRPRIALKSIPKWLSSECRRLLLSTTCTKPAVCLKWSRAANSCSRGISFATSGAPKAKCIPPGCSRTASCTWRTEPATALRRLRFGRRVTGKSARGDIAVPLRPRSSARNRGGLMPRRSSAFALTDLAEMQETGQRRRTGCRVLRERIKTLDGWLPRSRLACGGSRRFARAGRSRGR